MKVAVCLALLIATAMAAPRPRQLSNVGSALGSFVEKMVPVYAQAAAGTIEKDCESLCKKAIIAKKGSGLGTSLMASVTCPLTCHAAVNRVENALIKTTAAPSTTPKP